MKIGKKNAKDRFLKAASELARTKTPEELEAGRRDFDSNAKNAGRVALVCGLVLLSAFSKACDSGFPNRNVAAWIAAGSFLFGVLSLIRGYGYNSAANQHREALRLMPEA